MALKISKAGYDQALYHYTEQKENFLQRLQEITKQSYMENLNIFNSAIETNDKQVTGAVDKLINEINILFNTSSISKIKQSISNAYTRGQISKKTATQVAQTELNQLYTPFYIRSNILSKMGSIGGTSIQSINDNAMLGKIKMLLNMAARHSVLNPGSWARSQLEGILYEHAVIDGLSKYFRTFEDPSQKVNITGIGAKGGRGDINIEFITQGYNQTIPGITSYDIQSKFTTNFNYNNFVTSTEHNAKLRVGSGKNLIPIEMKKETISPEYSMYLLSQQDNVIKAIGKNTTIYAFAKGQFKFTADMIQNLFFDSNYALGMDKSAYIYWMKRKLDIV